MNDFLIRSFQYQSTRHVDGTNMCDDSTISLSNIASIGNRTFVVNITAMALRSVTMPCAVSVSLNQVAFVNGSELVFTGTNQLPSGAECSVSIVMTKCSFTNAMLVFGDLNLGNKILFFRPQC